MRGAALVWLHCLGCYSPAARIGVPCDPLTQACPTGQQCTDLGSGTFCVDPSTILDDAAIVSIDVNPAAPDPDACITLNGAGQLVLDALDSTTNQPWQGLE